MVVALEGALVLQIRALFKGQRHGSADSTALLENWFWTQSPPLFSGKIFDDPPPRSWPDGASTRTSIVSELEQRGAAEGKIIVTLTGRLFEVM